MKVTTIHTLKISYYTGGQGDQDALFLHGWASSGRMWLRSMWALRRDYRLWAPDLPGHGDSDAPELAWYSLESYTDHVAAFCESLGIRPYAVIGHSMGGRIALDLARRYPHLAERLVAVSPSITGRLGFNLNILLVGGLGRKALDFSRQVWPFATAETMSMYWAPRYLGSEAVKRTTEDLRRASWDAAVGSLRALVREDYSPHLAEIEHPTLLICGNRDYTIPPRDSRLAARALPQARLVMLRGVHHQPTDEAPQVFVQTLRSFLQNGQPEAV